MQRCLVALRDWVLGLLGRRPQHSEVGTRHRGPAIHVVILDGTMSTLKPGAETNAGLTYQLLREVGHSKNMTLYYESGIQWRDWRSSWDVMVGRGINKQIRRAYGAISSRYRPGDKIVFIGYSRGAYAVRSLAGVIDMVGLLSPNHATVSNIRTAYRHYEAGATSPAAQAFRDAYCQDDVKIEAIAVWDTVKALGVRLPVVWRFMNARHSFHNHGLGDSIANGFHAVAIDETRLAYAPVMWVTREGWTGRMEQLWFRGTHADVGGQISNVSAARPLANIPLVWLLSRVSACGVPFPDNWQSRFTQDVTAPSIGNWYGWAKFFWLRRRRVVGADPSERLHDSLVGADQIAQPAPARQT